MGTDFINQAAATELGILVAYGATDENVNSVAEATVLLMLALLYDLRGAEAAVRPYFKAEKRRPLHMMQGKTIGFAGFGPIARAVAARLQTREVTMLAYANCVQRQRAKLNNSSRFARPTPLRSNTFAGLPHATKHGRSAEFARRAHYACWYAFWVWKSSKKTDLQ